MPWPPIPVLGTAVAVITGFRSNAAYERLCEARQIGGGIINSSCSFAVSLRDLVQPYGDVVQTRRFVYRYLAWLTAPRHQWRQPRTCQTADHQHNAECRNRMHVVPKDDLDLDAELGKLLADEKRQGLQAKRDRTAAILALQSAGLSRLATAGALSDYRHVELSRFVTEF